MRTARAVMRQGAVLMEVVLALALFVGASVVVGMGLNASVNGMVRHRLNTHAGNLAITVMSELQMGMLPLESDGPYAFEEPFEAWTWETVVTEREGIEEGAEEIPVQVEVVVRHEEENIVVRLAQWLSRPDESMEPTDEFDPFN